MSFSDENVACTRNASIDEASPVTEQSRIYWKMHEPRALSIYTKYFGIPLTFDLIS